VVDAAPSTRRHFLVRVHEILRFLWLPFGAVFLAGIFYAQYALLRVTLDRRKKLGWLAAVFRFPWSAGDLSGEGLAYRKRALRALGVALSGVALAAMAAAIGTWLGGA